MSIGYQPPTNARPSAQRPTVRPTALTAVSNVSFYTADISALADYLIGYGYDVEPPKPRSHEWGRCWFCGSLVVLYATGTALVQGKAEPSMTLLGGLCEGGRS